MKHMTSKAMKLMGDRNRFIKTLILVFLLTSSDLYAVEHVVPAQAEPYEIVPLAPETHAKLSEEMKKRYPVGSLIAVLAGNTSTGYGALGPGFTTINWGRIPEHKPHIIKDFNNPDDFEDLANKFDIVIIEGPGPNNQFNRRMHESAIKILKSGGRLDVSFYHKQVLVISEMEKIFQREATYFNVSPGNLFIAFILSKDLEAYPKLYINHQLNRFSQILSGSRKTIKPVIYGKINEKYFQEVPKKKGGIGGLKLGPGELVQRYEKLNFHRLDWWPAPENVKFATLPHVYLAFKKE